MQRHRLFMRVIIGTVLVITGFSLMAVVFNPKGLLMPNDEPYAISLVSFLIATMIVFGGYLASGYNLKKIVEPLVIVWLFVVFWIIPLLYLPISRDALFLALGFSSFIPLLIWVGYTKLKLKYREKRKN